MRTFWRKTLLIILLTLPTVAHGENGYHVEKLAEGVYAAIAGNGGAATSNAFFVTGEDFVVAGGAHMTKEAIIDLFSAIAGTTSKPVRYFILPHHHPGFSHIDFDFPAGVELVMTLQTWQSLSGEVRKIANPVLFFGDGLTLKSGGQTIILTDIGPAHSSGDLCVLLPESKVLFAGDLLYVDSVGYMGEGSMRNWVEALDFLAQLDATRVIPGYGPVCGKTELDRFSTYFRDFLSAVLSHIDRGESLEQTVDSIQLPKYKSYEGYGRFLKVNTARAYRELKQISGD